MGFRQLLGMLCLVGATSGAAAGDLAVVGTGDGMDVLRAVGAAYTADNPETSVFVPPSVHSSGGISAVRTGTATLGRIARPLTLEERAEGIIEVPVFRLPSVFIVNPAANVRHLTAEQATRIFRGDITNWREVGGTDLRIKVVTRDEADSTLKVLRATMPGWRDLAVTEKTKLAATTQAAFDLVAELPGAVSFAPYSRSLEGIVLVPELDGRHVTDPDYPSAVTLSLIYREGTVTGAALDFVRYLFSPKARTLIRNFGGIPVRVQS
ncbi:MAG TPA: substrate-binding domain-containing protein [Xanthobacteraceae bacterium]|nr:substrate-binding domain-containing protein [Xanthobacteraceae bacterium]